MKTKYAMRYVLCVTGKKGFVILFAVMISSILLAIGLGVSNIAFREVKFGTSAKDANDAFFAADTGIECALFNDKDVSLFTGTNTEIQCLGGNISFNSNTGSFWSFDVVDLGSNRRSCSKVTVTKELDVDNVLVTTIVSKGYSVDDNSLTDDVVCIPSRNSVERELEVTY